MFNFGKEPPRDQSRIEEIGDQLHRGVGEMTQMAAIAAKREAGGNIADAGYLGSIAALGAMMPTTITFANMPQRDLREEFERDGQKVVAKYITPERLTFAALMAARVLTHFNAENGASTTEWGPHIFFEALSQWEKLYPDKKAEDYFNPRLIEAARAVKSDTKVASFDEFMAKRNKAFQPPKSMQ